MEIKKIATREAYGDALVEFGGENEDIVVLDADLAEATKTVKFKKAFPGRHIDCGIAEGNMMGVAAGLASTGKIVFASSFAMFAAGRAFEQIRNSIAYPHLNVKICATHGGITVGEDGATHQCLEDLGIMRTIPGMIVCCPADATEARLAVKAAIEYKGPVYLRFGRYAVPTLFDETYDFSFDRAAKLQDGTDVTVVANGYMVGVALEAAKALEEQGISAEVINAATVKPLDTATILASAKKTGCVVTCEEHNIIGALGSAVSECICENAPMPVVRVGINDSFGRSGTVPALLEKYGLTAESVVGACKKAIGMK